MRKYKYILVISLIWISCGSTSEFSGFSYDPPGVTNTNDKAIEPQKRRIIGSGSPKVWISNEFESARFNDFYSVGENKFEVLIRPENAPINNSPWYAFEIWSDSTHIIELTLRYEDARHRYDPKLWIQDSSGIISQRLDSVKYDSLNGTATLTLEVGPKPLRITAHYPEGILFSDLLTSLDSLRKMDFISVDTAGYSKQNRPVFQVIADETITERKGVLVLLSRQHPPEVSGYRVYQSLFDEMISDSKLAKSFREKFIIYAFPMLNPDGVVNGHWRHNAAGIDLNRDWINFNQPETHAVKESLLPLQSDPDKTVYYGIDFHSTNENIFYPINEEVKTFPDNVTQEWFQQVDSAFSDLNFRSEEFDTSSPISKNWIYRTFGSDALTFEVGDELQASETARLGAGSARYLMEILLREWEQAGKN